MIESTEGLEGVQSSSMQNLLSRATNAMVDNGEFGKAIDPAEVDEIRELLEFDDANDGVDVLEQMPADIKEI